MRYARDTNEHDDELLTNMAAIDGIDESVLAFPKKLGPALEDELEGTWTRYDADNARAIDMHMEGWSRRLA